MSSATAPGAAALLLAMGLVLVAMPFALVWLHRLRARQSISQDAPASHRAKAGTPTMGGLVIVAAFVTATVFVGRLDVYTVPGLALPVALGAIGFLDDLLIVLRGRNLGLRAREKLALQVVIAIAFVVVVGRSLPLFDTGARGWLGFGPLASALASPLSGVWPGAYPAVHAALDVLFLVGLANAVNFSDGLDGLASGLTAIAAVSFALLLPRGLAGSLGALALALAGACLGFLWYNCSPARVFMGDTGSLALGGALGALAVITRTELLFLLVGVVYWAELVSVVIQVAYFKRTGRRVFRMTPIHHHFELGGWKEPQIVTRFWLAGAAAGALALILGG